MIPHISVKVWDNIYTVDKTTTVAQMRLVVPTFFKNWIGKNNRYRAYRGCLITSYTSTYSDHSTKRCVVPYLFGFSMEQQEKDTFCLNTNCKSFKHARQIIDQTLDTGIARY